MPTCVPIFTPKTGLFSTKPAHSSASRRSTSPNSASRVHSLPHPTIAAILRNTEKFDGSSGEPILDDVPEIRDGSILAGKIMGRPVFETSHASATTLTLGRMSDVLIGQFGGVDFVIDEVTGASTSSITIDAFAFFDITVRRPQSFCVITGI